MVPIKTTTEDIQRLLTYLGKQIGWVEQPKIEKALGTIDDRKIGAMVEFGLILRDGGNLRTTPRGQQYTTDPEGTLREVLLNVDLYLATLEWVHYGKRAEATTAEIGQYWESSHKDTLGGLSGTTLASGAVTFGRVVDGAGLGTFFVGRSGKETRVAFELSSVDALIDGAPPAEAAKLEDTSHADPAETISDTSDQPVEHAPATQSLPTPAVPPTVTVATSPSVHVNVEIHIAADATADTVREIFRNMARYVLDKQITDDGE